MWDVLGFPGSFFQTQSPIYFDRPEVKAAIHAPNVTWSECSDIDVFPRGDRSLPPAFTVLPNAIEKSKRAVVVSSNTQLGMIVLLVTGSTPPLNIVAAHFACNSGAYVNNTKLRRV